MNFAVTVFKFFASLRLAIFLLLSLAFVFAVGTFVESAYGLEAARQLVYRSPWQSLLLVLLALNVAAAALDRLPWKKKHVGFVITHAGILFILAGSLFTRAYGVEGQMAIQEGETSSRIILNEAVMQIFSSESGPLISIPLPPRAFPWQGRKTLHEDPKAWLLRYYPKASREERIEEASEGPPALKVTLKSSFMEQSHWLLLDDPEGSRIFLGPAELRFTKEPLVVQKEGSQEGSLEFKFKDSSVTLPLPVKLGKRIPLSGTPYQVTLVRVLKDAVVEGDQLIDRSQAWNNPACELILEGQGLKEKHTVFSEFPDFPTLHGMKPSPSGVQIDYHRPRESSGPKNELRFIAQANGTPLYQIRAGEKTSEGKVSPGEEHETGWMDFKFRVERYYPHAEVNTSFREEPVHSQVPTHTSAAEIEVEGRGDRKSLWLGQGDKETLVLGGRPLQVIYGLRTLPLGFRLGLKDFRVENYPGTGRPASFESDVILKDDSAGTARDLTIRMNRPLRYRGFKVFQSGYEQPEGGPEVSIFTVAKDPGIPLKYAGAIIMIAGILTMFYTRRFSTRPGESLPASVPSYPKASAPRGKVGVSR